MIYIIGAGGVGSWLCPSLCLLVGHGGITLVDGDKLETKNLNRQLFDVDAVGANKAEALSETYGCEFKAQWYNYGSIEHLQTDWLLVCVDNDVARLAALKACDRFQCRAIFAANETTSAESYLYLPQWRDTRLDPRRYYPELLTNTAGDPQRAMGCTGEVQQSNRQLVSANFMAAALAQHLFVCWHLELPKMDNWTDIIPHLPYKLVANLSKLESFRVGTLEN